MKLIKTRILFFFDGKRKFKQSEHVVKLTRKYFFHLYIAKTYILSRNYDLRKLNKSKHVVELILKRLFHLYFAKTYILSRQLRKKRQNSSMFTTLVQPHATLKPKVTHARTTTLILGTTRAYRFLAPLFLLSVQSLLYATVSHDVTTMNRGSRFEPEHRTAEARTGDFQVFGFFAHPYPYAYT